MLKNKFKLILILITILIIAPLIIFYIKGMNQKIEYKNDQYGFIFSLPKSWEGYSIVFDNWQGYSIENGNDKFVEEGIIILIRHPEWSLSEPRQDIPIMIFTIEQWNMLQGDKFHIGAAPVGPSELGRNNKYVFALPARYNYAFLKGYEEVEKNLKENPLKPFDVK